MSLRQLLGTSGRSIPALRKPNGAPRQRHLASREPIVALRKLISVQGFEMMKNYNAFEVFRCFLGVLWIVSEAMLGG